MTCLLSSIKNYAALLQTPEWLSVRLKSVQNLEKVSFRKAAVSLAQKV